MIKFLIAILLMSSPLVAQGQAKSGANSDWSIRPAVTFGYNKAQKSYYSLGLNVQSWASEYILWGVGAFYSAGSPASSTREIGAGPFIAVFAPFTDNITGELRQEVLYVDQRQPLALDDSRYTTESGAVSVSSVGLHLKFAEHFGVSGGYRFVLGLTNDKLDDDRSGTFLGLAISI